MKTLTVVTAPEPLETIPPTPYRVFLAGGITDCPDWQNEEAIPHFLKAELEMDVILFNPRRPLFDINDPKHSEIQITWERAALEDSDIIMFWFPKGPSMCPITLYELGKYTARYPHSVIIGVDPEYKRSFDVHYQSMLEGIPVYTDLESTVDATVKLLGDMHGHV